MFEVVSPMAQDNTYAPSNDIVRVVRFRQLDISSEIMEDSDHEHVAVFLDGHIPNPPCIPSRSPPISQPPPPYSPTSTITYPATQIRSDTSSSPNYRSSYRSQTTEDDDPFSYDGNTTEDMPTSPSVNNYDPHNEKPVRSSEEPTLIETSKKNDVFFDSNDKIQVIIQKSPPGYDVKHEGLKDDDVCEEENETGDEEHEAGEEAKEDKTDNN